MATAFRSGTAGLIRDLFDGGTLAGLSDASLVERFVEGRDEAAFGALVARHGEMVRNTCRAVLKDPAGADDASQATFVLLFRKAGTIRGRDALGCWLHRVAYRVALQAASEAARRRDVEKAAGARRAEDAVGKEDPSVLLHEELERLPERFRLPLVLCDLEGLTRDQAASRLGLTEGSVRGRLAKARELLRGRLTQRGVNPALPLAAPSASPESLAALTARVAGGRGSAAAEALAEATLRGWAAARWKVVAAALVVGSASLAIAGSGAFEWPRVTARAASPAPSPANAPVPPDDPEGMAIEGRIVDLEGRPVAGASITVESADAAPEGKFDAWVDEIRRFGQLSNQGRLVALNGRPPQVPSAITGKDGRFRLEGLPRDGVVALTLAGSGVETSRLTVLTRDMPPLRVANPEVPDGRFGVYYGAKFDHVAAPARSVVGTVRDKDTGAPIAGVQVTGMPNIPNSLVPTPGVEATSDAQGRFEIRGLPASQGFKLFTEVPPGRPYVNFGFVAPAIDPRPGPRTFDIDLKPGVMVRGRITDKATGQPIRAWLEYYALRDNKYIDDYPNFKRDTQVTRVIVPDQTGNYAIPALPGRGLIVARGQFDQYLHGIGKDGIRGFDERLDAFPTYPFLCPVADKHAVAEINPEPGTKEITLDLQFDPGRTVRGTVVGPDGRPILEHVEVRTLDVFHNSRPATSATFEVTGLPSGPYRLDFIQAGGKLAGSVTLKGDESGPVVAKLQPWGTVTGRVVDEAGKPLTDVEIFSTIRGKADPERGDLEEKPKVDARGRFRIEGLVPGVKYDALGSSPRGNAGGPILNGVQVGPGEVKDLGDIVLPKGK